MIKIYNSRKKRLYLIPCIIIFFVALGTSTAQAQLSEYQQLLAKSRRPNIYITMFTLPGSNGQEVQLTAAFRMNYQLLTFKRLNKTGSNKYYATPSLSIKVYKSPRKNLRFKEEVSVIDLESVAHKSWSDTVYASNYKATTNVSNFATLFMQVPLSPGDYTYILQFGDSGNKRTSEARNIHVNAYKKSTQGEIILAGTIEKSNNTVQQLNLVNHGNSVPFGQKFYAFIHLSDYSTQKDYQLQVYNVQITDGDTTQIKKVFEQAVTQSQILAEVNPQLTKENDQLYLKLQKSDKVYTYALVQIPNSNFSEGKYKIKLVETGSENTVATKIYQSVWFEKPASLYKVDIAIKMLRFIVDKQTIERIGAGSTAAERKKLNEFWQSKDPTPNTAFNELKAEYYQRIDYAYMHYSSGRTPGFETDRGRIYILYGPPKDIERVYPTDSATREIWTYENRQFIFKATSGFGDFKLISN